MCSYYFFLCVESELGVVRVLLASRYARRNFSLVGEKMMSSRVTAWMGLKTGGDDDSIETPFFFFLVLAIEIVFGTEESEHVSPSTNPAIHG